MSFHFVHRSTSFQRLTSDVSTSDVEDKQGSDEEDTDDRTLGGEDKAVSG